MKFKNTQRINLTCKNCGKKFSHNLSFSAIKPKNCPRCAYSALRKKGKRGIKAKKTSKIKRVTNWEDKPMLALLKHVQTQFCNPYIRARDIANFGKCISCNSDITEAGHYYPVGSRPGMRFLVNNIHGQETSCNRFKSGNLLEYEKGLIARHGQAYVDKLKFDEQRYNASIETFNTFDVVQIGKTFKHLLKEEIWIFDTQDFNIWRDKLFNK